MADPTSITTPPGVTGNPPLPPTAPPSGFVPYIADRLKIPEFTLQAVLVGAVLGIVFGASSLYLVLRIGLTVSASIPVAVLSITLFRALSKVFGFRKATILENNITQTAGSAGESIAFAVGVTMPALMLLGFDMSLTRIMVVSVLGGLLGILMMIPLRRAFIVNMHGKPGQPDTLLYPEGTACAEVLINGEKGGTSGATVFIGFGIAFAVKLVIEGMNLLNATLTLPLKAYNRVAEISGEMGPELVGVGYVIGMRVASIMMAGAIVGNLVIVPAITNFGDTAPAVAGSKAISQMSLKEVQENYLRLIGAGCVTAAGLISMVRTLPLIVRSFRSSLGKVGRAGGSSRTERDLPPAFVLFGSLILLLLLGGYLGAELLAANQTGVAWKAGLGAVLILVFGFLFVTVSSRLTGEIGSSSNPISGMTVATLALVCLIFLSLGMTSPIESVLALSVGAVVCVAASNAGTTSQDLKTGYLVGATPALQQWAILIGALSSALVIGVLLLGINQAGTVITAKDLPGYKLGGDEVKRLVSGDELSHLAPAEKITHEGKEYLVWRPRAGDPTGVRAGKYYVEESSGAIAYLEDPAINGRISKRDDGTEVRLKFNAPKVQVVYLLISGVLESKLNWGLVLIGVALAVAMELCGVSSLAFAVGVYIPMAATTPIFLGGLVRYFVDRANVPKATTADRDEASAIAESETGSGVLLASGYIAGGSLAGVLVTFLGLPFFATIKEAIDFGGKDGPTWTWPVEGIDIAGLPLLLLLLLFLALVGMGKLLPTKPEEKGIPR